MGFKKIKNNITAEPTLKSTADICQRGKAGIDFAQEGKRPVVHSSLGTFTAASHIQTVSPSDVAGLQTHRSGVYYTSLPLCM